MIRVGCVPYLVARPLIHGLDRDGDLSLTFDSPGRLTKGLRSGRFDVALASSIEVFRSPGYTVIPDLAIGADGEVMSVRLFLRCPLAEVRSIALDPSSETAAALVKILVAEMIGEPVNCVPVPQGKTPGEVEADAFLRIGDPALRDSELSKENILDLAKAWKTLTGRPFVFALWIVRPGFQLGKKLEAFRVAASRGLASRDTLALKAAKDLGISPSEARRYLLEVCRYRFGKEEKEALLHFRDRASELELCRGDLQLNFQ